MHGVNEVGLNHGTVNMLHRIGCVDYIHLEIGKAKTMFFVYSRVSIAELQICFSNIQAFPFL